jgi:hypothetical protein
MVPRGGFRLTILDLEGEDIDGICCCDVGVMPTLTNAQVGTTSLNAVSEVDFDPMKVSDWRTSI